MAYQPPFSGKRISLKADSNSPIEKGVVTLASGTDITLNQAGSTITISSSGDGGGASDIEAVGVVKLYAGTTAPVGWSICDGSAVSRATFADLFAVIGETYGIGDGSTTFNLPDLRARIPVGAGTGTLVLTFSSRSTNTITVTGASNTADNEIQTGVAVAYSSTGTNIGGLTAGTYYIIRQSNTSFSLASSRANAVAGTAVTLSSDGTGTRTFTITVGSKTLGSTGGEETHTLVASEMPSHTHGVGTLAAANESAHTHTGPSHTHTGPSHTHTGPSHTHTFSGTSDNQGAHNHTSGHASGASSAGAAGPTFGFRYDGSNNAGSMTTSTDGAGGHTHTVSGTTGSDGTGNTGAGGTGATGSGGTGATGAGSAHTHTLSGSTGSAGSSSAQNNLQPFVVMNYIIKMVSEAVGDGTITAEYVRAELGSDQTTDISTGDHVKFNVVDASNGGSIVLDTSTTYTNSTGDSIGRFTLAADKTYSLRATLPRVLFGSTSAYLQYRWYNVTDGVDIGTKGAALPFTWSGSNVSNYPYAEAIISPTVETIVELRFTDAFSVSTIGGNDMMPSALVQMIRGVGVGGTVATGTGDGLSAIFNVSTKTTNYTITTDDTMVLADATSGSVTITLPAASGAVGYRFYIKRIDSTGNSVSIARSGSDTIDGATSISITGQWTVVGVVSDGSAWYAI